MKILLCDDDKASLDKLTVTVENYMKNKMFKYLIVSTTSSKSVIENEEIYDLAFLDIQMEKVDGLKLAETLKKRNENIILFFVTNHNEFQDDAMDLRVFRFFNKPFDEERVYAGLDKAMTYLNTNMVDIYLKDGKEQVKVFVNDICYVKRENRKLYIVTKNKVYETSGNLDNWIEKLPQTYFYLVHNSFFVNLNYVTKYSYTELLVNKDRISIATRKQADFRKYWFNYLRGK